MQIDFPTLYTDNFEIVSYKVLGVYIDENLTWKYYAEDVCKKILKSIVIMYKSSNVLIKRFMKKLKLFTAT